MPAKIVTLGDERYEFDESTLMLSDLFAIKAASGLDGEAFQRGLNRVDPAAYQVLVWFLRMKAGIHQDIKTVDFRVNDLLVTPVEEPETVPENPTETGSEPVETDI